MSPDQTGGNLLDAPGVVSMMCTCCAAPVAVSIGSAFRPGLAFLLLDVGQNRDDLSRALVRCGRLTPVPSLATVP